MKYILVPLALIVSFASAQKQDVRCADLKVGTNALGIVKRITDKGEFIVRRTNNGLGGYCRVTLWGVVLPRAGRFRREALHYLQNNFTGVEVRFVTRMRTHNCIAAEVIRNGPSFEGINFSLVAKGLALTSLPEEPVFKYFVKQAKENHRGMWAKRS